MKRWTGFLLGICLMMLSGCASGPSSADSSAPVGLEGTYVQEIQKVEETYWPTLILEEDGTFQFQVNLLSGMGKLWGQYSFHDQQLVLTVGGKDFDGFLGDDAKLLYFEIASEDSLMFDGADSVTAIGMTEEMDLFRRQSQE